jgi:hypothetical protein
MSAGLVSLGMIGGFLHKKTPEIVSEYLPVAKMLDGGSGLGGVMGSVLQSGGLQNIMSNPLGAISSQLQGTIAQGVTSLSGLTGAGTLVSSLSGPGGLLGAVSNLTGMAGQLQSGQGVLGVLSHSSISDLAGPALPPALGLDRVVAPLFADGMLMYVDTAVSDVVSRVTSGNLTVDAAVPTVQGFTTTTQSLVDASRYALNTLSGVDVLAGSSSMAADITAVHSLASVVATSLNPDAASNTSQLVVDALSRGLNPDVIQQMLDSVATHVND